MDDLDRAGTGKARSDALDRVAAAAHGWHRIQLAVLGFIGFCGVLWDNDGSTTPAGVQWIAAAAAVLAFVLALLATYLVGSVAYPTDGPTSAPDQAEEVQLTSQRRRLHAGIASTYLAVALLVMATLSAWVPSSTQVDRAVVARDAAGRGWCGHLVDAPAGGLGLATADGRVTIPLDRVARLGLVEAC